MSMNPGASGGVERRGSGIHTVRTGNGAHGGLSSDVLPRLARAYMATYRGPHGDAPGADAAVTGPVQRTDLSCFRPAPSHAKYDKNRSDPARDDRNHRAE